MYRYRQIFPAPPRNGEVLPSGAYKGIHGARPYMLETLNRGTPRLEMPLFWVLQ